MTITVAIIAGALFVIAYFSKRKYGLPALGLLAGSVISSTWSSSVAHFLKENGLVLVSPPLSVVVAIILLLLPGLLFLAVGPKYGKKYKRVLSAAAFALVASSLVVITVTREAPDLIAADTFVQQIKIWQTSIVTVGLIAAIVDAFIHHMPSKSKKELH